MKIKVSDYIIKRLEKFGVKHIFGLPGDYNFNLLESVVQNPDVEWINCTNELNAAYAADGYARVKGFGAVITTFGVGELSAINGIAGAYSENVPVMKIVGVPNTKSIREKELLHHNFATPDYFAYERAYKNVCAETVFLDDVKDIKDKIDTVSEIFYKTKKPVYLAVPIDICGVLIEDEIPEIRINSDGKNLADTVSRIVEILNGAKRPLFLADYLLKRFKTGDLIKELAKKTNALVTSMIMGKGLYDETEKEFIGVNHGVFGDENFRKIYESCDVVINFGAHFSDMNTLGFAAMPDERFRVEIQPHWVKIDGEKFENVYIKDVIQGILNKDLSPKAPVDGNFRGYKEIITSDNELKTDEIFPILQGFLKENDTLILDTGIVVYPASKMKLKKGAEFMTQALWGSIGWATPACFGAGIADRTRRTILVTGDGAHQLTVQEVSNLLKYEIKPVILLLDNCGYTIERLLRGRADDVFNDIKSWDYKKILEGFCGKFDYYAVKSSRELQNALEKANAGQKERLQFIEMTTGKTDVPEITRKMAKEH